MKGCFRMQVTFKEDQINVKGTPPNVAERDTYATLTTRQSEDLKLSSYFGNQPVVVSVVHDVQTRTCELQTKRFSKELAKKDVIYLTVSRNTVDEFNQWN